MNKDKSDLGPERETILPVICSSATYDSVAVVFYKSLCLSKPTSTHGLKRLTPCHPYPPWFICVAGLELYYGQTFLVISAFCYFWAEPSKPQSMHLMLKNCLSFVRSRQRPVKNFIVSNFLYIIYGFHLPLTGNSKVFYPH